MSDETIDYWIHITMKHTLSVDMYGTYVPYNTTIKKCFTRATIPLQERRSNFQIIPF